MILTPEQAAAVAKMAAEPTRAALSASELGTGKTCMAVELGRALGAQVIMIVAPLHTRYGWHETFTRQGYTHPFNVVSNKNKEGKAAQVALKAKVPGVYFVGREWFRLQDWAGISVDYFVWDECHVLKTKTSAGVKALKTLKRGYTLLQSATPFGSEFTGAWSVARCAWGNIIDRLSPLAERVLPDGV